MVRPRFGELLFAAGGGVALSLVGSGVLVFQWGKYIRLPGGRVYRCPVGLIHTTVPSASC
jgi:hypothetical protein